jgi:hypothetical protein
MRTNPKDEINNILRTQGPKLVVYYYKGEYNKFADGNYYPLSQRKVLKLLLDLPQTEILFFQIDERKFSLETGRWEGKEPNDFIPDELRGYKVQKITCDSKETMKLIINIRYGISRTKDS